MKPAIDTVEALEQSLNVLLRLLRSPRLSDRVRGEAAATLDRVGYVVLLRVAELAPARLSDVAHALAIDISTASRQVARLEERGLVTRSADPEDGRAIRLSLSPEGQGELARTKAAWQATVAAVVGAWPERDVDELSSLLSRFADELRDALDEGA
jgi:DNA-binding MarR family transcriptional regulator